MALAIYRQLLRSARIAFSGDITALTAARAAAREGFQSNRDIPSHEIPEAFQHAKDVALILRQNVVQGRREEGSDRYKLNIHEETERGDNDSIKDPPPMIMGKGADRLRGSKCGTL